MRRRPRSRHHPRRDSSQIESDTNHTTIWEDQSSEYSTPNAPTSKWQVSSKSEESERYIKPIFQAGIGNLEP